MNLPSAPSLSESSEWCNISNMVLFTCILYESDTPEWKIRFPLFLEMLECAKKIGISVVVVDDGTSPDYLGQLKKFDNLTIVEGSENIDTEDLKNGMSASRRFAARSAMTRFPKKTHFLYMAPEKVDMADSWKLLYILWEMISRKVEGTIIWRKNMEDLLVFRARSESIGNRYLEKCIPENKRWSVPLDFFFGVGVYTRGLLEKYYLKDRWDKWSEDSLPMIRAIHAWEKIGDIRVDFSYPPIQMDHEETLSNSEGYKQKRVLQLRAIWHQAALAIGKIEPIKEEK